MKYMLALILLIFALNGCTINNTNKKIRISAKLLMPDGKLQYISATRFSVLSAPPLAHLINKPNEKLINIENKLIELDKQSNYTRDLFQEGGKKLEETRRSIGSWGFYNKLADYQNISNATQSSISNEGLYRRIIIKDFNELVTSSYGAPSNDFLISTFVTNENGEATINIDTKKLPVWIISYVQLANNNLCLSKLVDNNSLIENMIYITVQDIDYNLANEDINKVRDLINTVIQEVSNI